MSSTDENIAYLREHLSYELLMLRYTLRRLDAERDVLGWNALFESFAVHARNLESFLTNGDGNNKKAKEYVADFRAKKDKDVITAFNRLNAQVLHLAKGRPTSREGKVDTDIAQAVALWVDCWFQVFVNAVPEPYKSAWNPTDAEPPSGDTIRIESGQPSATNHIITSGTGGNA